ncbi:aminopeptidase M1 isoform X1 [Cajanus cajan]|uniref:Aminopeptidase n=1 Tax=Cajanus cajan TaxID=3821 RepID=A0A151T9C7_CAJCA|nr:aminopeptidase M1 isoform X1 [Cajanus cajan]KYP63648.1 Puromycin-sensitive aminopeptidase [Cajanus cajan]
MDQKQSIDKFKGKTRLPSFAIPKRYELHLTPDLSSCTFTGTVQISLTINESTNFLVLNALELVIQNIRFTNSQGQQHTPSDVVVDNDDEILVLVFDETLSVGGVLRIEFSGILNEQLTGLYKCTYVDGGVKKNMAVTQFEAVDARRCFPCWDEPALKATFKVTLTVPSELTALSNMPVENEKLDGVLKTLYFEKSPLMSTYLVAVVVGLFDYNEVTTIDGVKVRVYCAVGKKDQGKLAMDIAVKSLDIFTKYFSVPYPLSKLDLVAVPEFSGGAMENYGLIVYRENELLYHDLYSTAAKKQRITIVTAHEVAHQWFGNLVTMEWWTHLWLNEGFATWVSYMATDILFPEWNIWSKFLLDAADGLRMDALEKSHPIEVEIHHARSVIEIFDAVSYYKGSAVIRMLQGYLGDVAFQKSLSTYIGRYQAQNAKTEDLWNVLSEISGVPANLMMNTWTKKAGYPVIHVELIDGILKFKQSQFLLFGQHVDGQWIVPITMSIGSYERQKKFLLETSHGRVDISELIQSIGDDTNSNEKKYEDDSQENIWVKVNVDQSGFYRVNYEDKLALRLRKAIQQNCLLPTDKFGILDDGNALCQACEQSLSTLLMLMDVYRKDFDYVIVSKLINVCLDVLKISMDAIPDSVNELKQYFISLLMFSAEQLGWDSKSGEDHSISLLRGEVFQALATFDHDKTQEEALRRFQILLDDRNTSLLPANIRKVAYVAVMRNTTTENRTGLESLLSFYRSTDVLQEREKILRCIASSADPNVVIEVLNLLLSDEIPDQDMIYVLAGISMEGSEAAWRWLKDNWERILAKYGAGLLLTNFIRQIVPLVNSDEKADEIETFFASHMNHSIVMNLKLSIEQIRIKARWIRSVEQEHSLPDLIKQLAQRK